MNDIGLFVRCADSVYGLFTDGIETKCILDYDEKRGLCQTFWAPEFHMIRGRLYILFAVSNKNWGPQCHMMRLKEGGDACGPAYVVGYLKAKNGADLLDINSWKKDPTGD